MTRSMVMILMRVTLFKATCYQNPDADKEKQEFVIYIMPHVGRWRDANVQKESYKLNNPQLAVYENANEGILKNQYSIVGLDNGNAEIEVVKIAELRKAISANFKLFLILD